MATTDNRAWKGASTAAGRALLGIGLLAGVLGSTGCGRRNAEAHAEAGAAVPAVRVATPQRRTFHRVIEQPARIEPFEITPIFAKITGYAAEVEIEAGRRVHKGDVLAKVLVPELVEELAQKETLVTQARLEITQAEKSLRVARAQPRTMKALALEARAGLKRTAASHERWKSELKRMEGLNLAKVIDGQTRDEALQQLRAAEASQDEADAKVQAADAALVETEAKQEKAEADLASARNRLEVALTEQRRVAALLGYAEIRAPFDGVVTERHVHTGHFLQPASGAADKAQPLFVVVRTDRVRVFLDVPEADAVLVRDGRNGSVRIPALNDRAFTGKVAGSSWSLDPGQRTLRTEIDFDNPGELLRPGMYAHASIPVEQPDALCVPAAAVVIRDGQSFCYCVSGGKAIKTVIRIGHREGDVVEVLKKRVRSTQPGETPGWEDFSAKETVIITNPGELTDGQPIQIEPGGNEKRTGGIG